MQNSNPVKLIQSSARSALALSIFMAVIFGLIVIYELSTNTLFESTYRGVSGLVVLGLFVVMIVIAARLKKETMSAPAKNRITQLIVISAVILLLGTIGIIVNGTGGGITFILTVVLLIVLLVNRAKLK